VHQYKIFRQGAGVMEAVKQRMITASRARRSAAVILLALLALALATPLAATEAKDYQAVKALNTVKGWELYLKKHPRGAHAREARDTHDHLLLQEAHVKAGDPAGLEAIVKRCVTPGMTDQISDLWEEAVWKASQREGTDGAFRAYLKRFPWGRHAEEAKSALERVSWRSCTDSGRKETCESYLKEYPQGAHADDVRKALDDLVYESVREKGTIEAFEAYVKVHPERKEALKKLRELRYAKAESTGTLEDWEAYYQKGRYSGWLYRRGFEKMDDRAASEIERLLAEKIVEDPSLELCRGYLGRFPKGIRAEDVVEAMEPFLFDEAMAADKAELCLEYLDRYPQGHRDKEIRDRLDPILFRKAQDEDTYSSYGEYLGRCPDCANSSRARERLAWLRKNPAVVEISCPSEVEGDGYWKWDTVFTETSGKAGFRVSGTGYVLDPKGGKWGTGGRWTERGSVSVKAGGKGSDDYWCRSGDHELCNGYAVFTWTGEDAGGHPIMLEERVKLVHTGCTGPKK
jgi:hypothetical protein